MQKISGFLERFKNLTILNEAVRKKIVEIIKNETGVNSTTKDISIRDSVAYIRLGGPAKSEIFLKKKIILEKLNEHDADNKIVDIR